MTCRDFHECLGDLFENSLAPGERRAARAHLLQCRDCKRSKRSYEETVALARSAYALSGREESRPVPEEMVQRILAAARPKGFSPAIGGLVQLISGIAASQLIVFYWGH